ncbi:MAG: pyridoxal phosphate-dependent aminotransferase [Flectobacillus sp.]|uniref:pyridoxal phosphate-dependent aminotransferase n=1 Tax=Flectobacillus sp. TaxID=50419 RepID=UPI003B99E6B2
MFDDSTVNVGVLKERAYNLRWATVPEGVIPLTAADPDFPSAPEIAESLTKFIKDRYLCYGPPDGLPQFKESVSQFFRQKRNVPANPAYTMPVDSAAFGIYVICKAFLGKGDEAIIFNPVDFLFKYSVETVGAIAIPYSIPSGKESVDFTEIEALITPKTKMICLCNPLNPTGKVFSAEELNVLGTIAVKHNLIILSDEIWSDIVFQPFCYTSIASLDEAIRQQTIIVTGYSKSYGLAGLRIGSILAFNQAHFDKVFQASLHQSTVHGANVLGQIAVTTALNECGYWLEGFISHLQKMRDLCVAELSSSKGVSIIPPQGCYVAFADITGTGKTSAEIHAYLLETAKVAIVPGLPQWFGSEAEGYIRLSFATSNEILSNALYHIKTALNNL